MLCFIVLRTYCPKTIKNILKIDNLSFKQNVDIDSGETWVYGARAMDNGLHFQYKRTEKKEDCIEISGSLHKYSNLGIHNYNDFWLEDIYNVVYKFAKEFGLNPNTTTIHGLEFGVNIQLQFPARQILNEIILFKKQLGNTDRFRGKGLLRSFEFDEYVLKLYDKGAQYKLENYNIIRIEKKYKTIASLPKNCEIKYLADLFKINNYKLLAEDLKNCLNELIINDTEINLANLSKPKAKILLQSRNLNYWDNLIHGNQYTYQSSKNRFNNLIDQLNQKKYKQLLTALIDEKLCSFYNEFNSVLYKANSFLEYTKDKGFLELQNLPEKNCTIFSLLDNNKVNSSNSKYCLVCKRDISNQKKESKFCSEKNYGKAGKRCRDKYRRMQSKINSLAAQKHE